MKIDMQQQVREMTPVTVEPAVSFQSRDYRTFINNGTYDIIFLTQSPGYTPASADILIPVIQSYMNKQTANV